MCQVQRRLLRANQRYSNPHGDRFPGLRRESNIRAHMIALAARGAGLNLGRSVLQRAPARVFGIFPSAIAGEIAIEFQHEILREVGRFARSGGVLTSDGARLGMNLHRAPTMESIEHHVGVIGLREDDAERAAVVGWRHLYSGLVGVQQHAIEVRKRLFVFVFEV